MLSIRLLTDIYITDLAVAPVSFWMEFRPGISSLDIKVEIMWSEGIYISNK